jgi:hypothetical protein
LLSLDKKQRNLIKHTCIPKGLSLYNHLHREFLKHCGRRSQQFEDIIQDLEDAFRKEILPLDPIENLREVSSLPIEESLDEVPLPPSNEEVFEEQVCEEKEDSKEVRDLDKTSPAKEKAHDGEKNKSLFFNPLENNQMKHSSLRIKPLVMKRFLKNMPMKKVPRRKGRIMIKCKHVEDLDETLVSILPLDEGEEVINPNDTVDQHIDDFIHVGRHRWDMGCFIFYGDPIYDIEGSFQKKSVELSSSENWSSYLDDPSIWQPDDDMSADGSHPSWDDLSQYTHDDFQSYLGSCDAYPFEHSNLLYDFQPSLHSNFDRHKTLVNPKQSETHTIEQQCFYLGGCCRDAQIKKQYDLNVEKILSLDLSLSLSHIFFLGKIWFLLWISHLISSFRDQCYSKQG